MKLSAPPSTKSIAKAAKPMTTVDDDNNLHMSKKASKNRRLSVKDVMDAIRSTPTKARDESDIALVLIGRLLPAEFREYVRRFRGGHETSIMYANPPEKLTPKSLLLQHLASSPEQRTVAAQSATASPISMASDDAEPEEADMGARSAMIVDEASMNEQEELEENVVEKVNSNENPFKPKKALTRTPPKAELSTSASATTAEMITTSSPLATAAAIDIKPELCISESIPLERSLDTKEDVEVQVEAVEDEVEQHDWTSAELEKASEVVRRMSMLDPEIHENHPHLHPDELAFLRDELDSLKAELDAQRELLQTSLDDRAQLQSRLDGLESKIQSSQQQVESGPSQQYFDQVIDDELEVMKKEMKRLDAIKQMILERRHRRHAQQEQLFEAIQERPITIEVPQASSSINGNIIVSPKPMFSSDLAPALAQHCLKPIPIKAEHAIGGKPLSAFSSKIPKIVSSSSSSSSAIKDVGMVVKDRDLRSDRTSFTSAAIAKMEAGLQSDNAPDNIESAIADYDEHEPMPMNMGDNDDHLAYDDMMATMTEAAKPRSDKKQRSSAAASHHRGSIKVKNRVLDDIADCVKSHEKQKRDKKTRGGTRYRGTQLHERWKDIAIDDIDRRPAMAKAGNMQFVPLQAILTTLQSQSQHDHDQQKIPIEKELFPEPTSSLDEDHDVMDETATVAAAEETDKRPMKKRFNKVSKDNEQEESSWDREVTTDIPAVAASENEEDQPIIEKKTKRARKASKNKKPSSIVIEEEQEPIVFESRDTDKTKKSKPSAKDKAILAASAPISDIPDENIKVPAIAVQTSKKSRARDSSKSEGNVIDRKIASDVDDDDAAEITSQTTSKAVDAAEELPVKKTSRSKRKKSAEVEEDDDTSVSASLKVAPTAAVCDDSNSSKDEKDNKPAKKRAARKPKAIQSSLKDEQMITRPLSSSSSSAILSAAAVASAQPMIEERALSPVQSSEEHHDIHLALHDDDSEDELVLMVKPPTKSSKKRKPISVSSKSRINATATDQSAAAGEEEKENRAQEFAFPMPKKKKVDTEAATKPQPMSSPVSKAPIAMPVLSTNRSDFSVARTTALLNTSVG
jgi:hypothetical protein